MLLFTPASPLLLNDAFKKPAAAACHSRISIERVATNYSVIMEDIMPAYGLGWISLTRTRILLEGGLLLACLIHPGDLVASQFCPTSRARALLSAQKDVQEQKSRLQ
jgi:hypothetical protein